MSEISTTPLPQAPRKSNKTTFIIAVMAVVIIVQGIKIYLDSQEKQEVKTQLTSTEQELATTMQRMEEIKTELNEKIAEVQKLGGNVADLEKAKAEIETELKRSKRANGKVIKELKDHIGLKEILYTMQNHFLVHLNFDQLPKSSGRVEVLQNNHNRYHR